MKQKELKTETEYNDAVTRAVTIFHAEPDTPESNELDLLLSLIKDYEDKNIFVPCIL